VDRKSPRSDPCRPWSGPTRHRPSARRGSRRPTGETREGTAPENSGTRRTGRPGREARGGSGGRTRGKLPGTGGPPPVGISEGRYRRRTELRPPGLALGAPRGFALVAADDAAAGLRNRRFDRRRSSTAGRLASIAGQPAPDRQPRRRAARGPSGHPGRSARPLGRLLRGAFAVSRLGSSRPRSHRDAPDVTHTACVDVGRLTLPGRGDAARVTARNGLALLRLTCVNVPIGPAAPPLRSGSFTLPGHCCGRSRAAVSEV